jgi:hypothetical protein
MPRPNEVYFQPAKMHRINLYHFHFNLLPQIYVAPSETLSADFSLGVALRAAAGLPTVFRHREMHGGEVEDLTAQSYESRVRPPPRPCLPPHVRVRGYGAGVGG